VVVGGGVDGGIVLDGDVDGVWLIGYNTID
jgi:hypothetical protein